jgi:ubiquinone/menaquinone biosynthesis C-methylase UbiE
MSQTQKFWDRMAEKYYRDPIKDMESYETKLAKTREHMTPDSEVLEFGCGTGGTAVLHAPHVKSILATDISGEMLAIGERRAAEAGVENIEFRRGTMQDLDLEPGRFDIALGMSILHLLPDRRGDMARVRETLKPGGVFISSTVVLADMWWLWPVLQLGRLFGAVPYVKFFTRRQFLASVEESGFVIEEEWRPNNGRFIFLIARKA